MNLIKVGHTHTFWNMDYESPLPVASAPNPFALCPLGHSDCIMNHTSVVTNRITNANRTTAQNLNLCSKTHLHTLQKKGYSDESVGGIVQANFDECDAGHTNCVIQIPYYYDSLRVTISALGNGETLGFSPTNLVKMSSHTHTVTNSLTDENYHILAVRVFEECPAGHSECLFMHADALASISYLSATTSSGWI